MGGNILKIYSDDPNLPYKTTSARAAPMIVNGLLGLAAFYRIRDTVENREALRAALAEFHDKRLLTLAELDGVIEELRREIRESILPILR